MNSHPTRFERIMLLTAFPPAPPTPTTVMRGFSSCSSLGMLRLIILEPSKPLAAVIAGVRSTLVAPTFKSAPERSRIGVRAPPAERRNITCFGVGKYTGSGQNHQLR